ncbi:hypothetical protein [Sphingomonas sp. F9_3S_D5_B_2]
MRFERKLPAKVIKRVGQLRRLGPTGLAHTAYVAMLGRAVYSLTDPAREIAVRLHRRKVLSRALAPRTDRLKERVRELGDGKAAGCTKTFATDRGRFVQVLEAVLDLTTGGCAVPSIAGVDWNASAITFSAVSGVPLRQALARCAEPARRQILDAVAGKLLEIHRAGYVLGHIGEGDVLLSDDSQAVFVALDQALPLAGLSRDMSVYLRDKDRQQFNERFGTRLITAASLRSPQSASESAAFSDGDQVYAPILIREDVHWGKLWNPDVGIGRWNYIMKEHLPIPLGGTVLDLGSNNGFNPLQMLRSGARSAIGIELDAQAIREAALVKSAYEWLDNRAYDFRSIEGSHADLPSFGLPRFDVVTALCTLYYVSEAEMRETVRYIRSLTNVLVLQCNTDRLIDRSSQDTYRKASVEFAIEILKTAGFENCEVIAPAGYSRPLVIGRP